MMMDGQVLHPLWTSGRARHYLLTAVATYYYYYHYYHYYYYYYYYYYEIARPPVS